MVARGRRETVTMTVCFERDGEAPECLEATDGRQAVAHAVGFLLRHRKLRAGDRITVELAD